MRAQNNYNQSPKPFVRSTGGFEHQQHMQYRQVPKILVNDNNNNLSASSRQPQNVLPQQHHHLSYPKPTSTVHKSLMGSRVNWVSTSSLNEASMGHHESSSQAFSTSQVPYSRLITSPPPQQQHSYYPGDASTTHEPQAHYRQNQQQQQQQPLLHRQQPQQQQQTLGALSSPYVGAQLLRDNLGLTKTSQSSGLKQYKSSNVVLPDTKRLEYMRDKNLEQVSIAHQTYRTTPIVSPKPKARHDLATGNYMRLNYDPTWDLAATKSLGPLKFPCKPQPIQPVGHAEQQQQHQPTTSATHSAVYDSDVPVFNYREYIESQRKQQA